MKRKKFQKKYEEIWEDVKKEIETIIGSENIENLKKISLNLMMICH